MYCGIYNVYSIKNMKIAQRLHDYLKCLYKNIFIIYVLVLYIFTFIIYIHTIIIFLKDKL